MYVAMKVAAQMGRGSSHTDDSENKQSNTEGDSPFIWRNQAPYPYRNSTRC